MESVVNLGNIAVLTFLSFRIHEHVMFFHFLRSLISTIFYCFQSMSFELVLLNLFLSILFFDAVLNGIQMKFLICKYTKIIDFCLLILYIETLLNILFILIVFKWILWIFYLYHQIILSTSREIYFYLSILYAFYFIFFPCLIDPAGISSTMLNRSSENRHS